MTDVDRSSRAVRSQRGQVLPLFALFLLVLLGFAALAIDVSGALAARRLYRSAADAAALAGGQDLQVGTTRAVTDRARTQARTDAMARLVSLMGATSTPTTGTCDPSDQVNQIVDCALPGTPYLVSIKTPSPTCVSCDPNRSIQVTVRNPTYGLAFARVFSQFTWNIASTSVAGLTFNKSYTIVTLRPPAQVGNTFDVRDIVLNGNGTTVVVHTGDVGTNSNMTYSGLGAVLTLDSGYDMYYFDPNSGPLWGASPPGNKLGELIQDPGYRYPSMTGAPTFDDARQSKVPLPAVTRADQDPSCLNQAKKIDPTAYTWITAQLLAPSTIYCYKPGIYHSGTGAKNATITIPTGTLGILEPGAYYLQSGLDVSGRLIGGYEPGKPGVALMFDEVGPGNCSSCIFSGNNALTIALNAGTKFPFGTAGTAATAAIDWSGQPVQTSGAASPSPPLIITILVKPDTNGPGGSQACVVPGSPPYVEPTGCDDNRNQTINIAGGGQLGLEGVQYLPTDNVAIAGSSDGKGSVGQIIAWTLTYSGGTTINQEGADAGGPGILRLDAACTAPATPCNNP